MRSTLKRAFFVLVFSLMIFGTFLIKKYRLGGFRLAKILKTPNSFEYVHEGDSSLNEILLNYFHYLGRGTQFYAFESVDQKYVIKILRSDRLNIRFREKIFPKKVSKIKLKNKKRKKRFFNACTIAYNNLKQQTGIICLHLAPTLRLCSLKVIDNFSLYKKIDLNDYCFLVQKKAKLIKESFQEDKINNDVSSAKKKIRSFLAIIKARAKLGISNTDPNVFMNFGFINNQAIELDFGDFYQNYNLLKNKLTFQTEISKYALILRKWLGLFWPELVSYFDEQYNQALDCEEIFN